LYAFFPIFFLSYALSLFRPRFRVQVAPTAAAGCRSAGCSAAATKNVLREFAAAGTAAHRVSCFARRFAFAGQNHGGGRGSGGSGGSDGGGGGSCGGGLGSGSREGSSSSSSSSGFGGSERDGQVVAAVAAAASTLLEGYRMEVLALADGWRLGAATSGAAAPGAAASGAAASGATAAHGSLAAVLSATRPLRRAVLRLAELLGCGDQLHAPRNTASATRPAATRASSAAAAPAPASAFPAAHELRSAFEAFPRGPSLLSYLYEQAALEEDNDAGAGRLATALLVAGLKPYLALCSKWLFATAPLGRAQVRSKSNNHPTNQ
jgi:hypothetical protein